LGEKKGSKAVEKRREKKFIDLCIFAPVFTHVSSAAGVLAGSLEVGDQKCTKSAYSVKQIDAEKSFSLDSPLGRIFLYNLLLGFNDLLKFIFLRKNTNM